MLRPMRGSIRKGIVVFGVASAMLTESAAADAAPGARFIYIRGKGAETCPSETEVRDAVRVRLGYEVFSIFATSTMFTEVSAIKGGFTANLKLVDASNTVRGDRVLVVRGNCAELMDAMALTISIAIDPMSVTRGESTSKAAPETTSAATSSTSTETQMEGAGNDAPRLTTPSPTTDGGSPALRGTEPGSESLAGAESPANDGVGDRDGAVSKAAFVAVGPLVGIGSAPTLSVGGAFGVDGHLGRVAGGLEARADLASSAAANGASGRMQGSLLAGTLFAGIRQGPLFAGGVLLRGQVSATGTGVEQAREPTALLAATGVRVGVAVPLSERVEARARVEGLANLTRHTLELDGREVFEYPPAFASVSVGIAMRIW